MITFNIGEGLTFYMERVGRREGDSWFRCSAGKSGIYTNIGPWIVDLYRRRD